VLEGHEDVTLFEEAVCFVKAVRDAVTPCSDLTTGANSAAENEDIGERKSFDLFGSISFAGAAPDAKQCRIHAASCQDREYFSVTIRKPPKPTQPVNWSPNLRGGSEWEDLNSIFLCASLENKDWQPPQGKYLSTLCDVADILYSQIFDKKSKATGLVLITGATGSGKTTVLNSLLLKYLHAGLTPLPNRRPHVVAVGDPVETILNQTDGKTCGAYQCDSSHYSQRAVDFTSRTLGKDVDSVQDALRDALRETPDAVVISELRDRRDFMSTLTFAETGQLAFATAHSTSLIDAMRKLISFSPASESPSGRSLLAQRLKAVIHLRNISIPDGGEITLPSVWLHNSSGIRNFVSDGLASILPRGSSGGDENRDGQKSGVLGLAWAAERLLGSKPEYKKLQAVKDNLRQEAHKLDLEVS